MSFSHNSAVFSKKLLRWYASNKRDLPWRNSTDPYKIWLSEIILQQTRVKQGLPYYQEFTKKFPTVQALAAADEKIVLRTWQGLGYYSRARNLHKCAKIINDQYNGDFPDTYDELLKLPGIGPYTAAAIASFAFRQPHAVVDGNVFRVLSRAFGVTKDIASSAGQKYFRKLANELIDPDDPGEYNQAIMEFGALHCTPSSPDCETCFYADSCYANQQGLQSTLPVKTKKTRVRNRYLQYVVIRYAGKIYMKPRTEKDIWQGLYDFPLVESGLFLEEEDLLSAIRSEATLPENAVLESVSRDYTHQLSHQKLHARFLLLECGDQKPEFSDPSVHIFNMDQVLDLPKPVLISRYLNDYIF